MILNESFPLSNGTAIPKLGLGTWFISDEHAQRAVEDATGLGYRHIDTAQAYGNENGVGKGVRACGLTRESLFVTTKLAAEVKSYAEAVTSIDQSIQTLGLEYIDLMIIHSPKPWREFLGTEAFLDGNREAWRALEDAYRAGKLQAIGLSNFEKPDVKNILDVCTVRPMVNQILAHIGNTPLDLIDYCQGEGMLIEAYSPVAHGELMKHEVVAKLAQKYQVSIPQLSIRYCLELGLLPLPKTANPAHMKANAEVDFTITPEDMEFLKKLEPLKDYGSASKFPVYAPKAQ